MDIGDMSTRMTFQSSALMAIEKGAPLICLQIAAASLIWSNQRIKLHVKSQSGKEIPEILENKSQCIVANRFFTKQSRLFPLNSLHPILSVG